jgi:choice-of-anchor B domain-containing protein
MFSDVPNKIKRNFESKEMLRIFPLYILFLFGLGSYGQTNMTQLGYLDIPAMHGLKLNDIWGYTDEAGNDYALVGAMNGVSIVDVTDPADPVEIAWFWGLESVWRDIKTVGDYAYVTTEADAGMWIIDLSPLPASFDLPVIAYNGPVTDPWSTAHNLYADDQYVYIFGAGRDNGGVIILDVLTDPLNPIEVGTFDNWYVHDGVVLNDTGYFGHIYEGFFSIVDLSDPAAPTLISTLSSPTFFTHNIWPSEDGNYAFTTDEVTGGYLGAFDITDPAAPKEIDKIQSSPGQGVVPHNTHVLGDYLVTSYYTDGVVIHDILNPSNMVEVANFDTSPLASTGTQGCWGVYPFFGMDKIIASDREEGLFVLSADPHPGSYLHGNVIDQATGFPLNNVSIEIVVPDIEDFTNPLGDYQIGIEDSGDFQVIYSKVLYFPDTITVNGFKWGDTIFQNVSLDPIPQFTQQFKVLDQVLAPVEGAEVKVQHTYITHTGITDAAGIVLIDMYYQDNYQLYAGKWGHVTYCDETKYIDGTLSTINMQIDTGYYDDFTLDFGWTSSGSASKGLWEREIPVGVTGGEGSIQNPYFDTQMDCGEFAFLTGNGTTSPNDQEVENGDAVLISPPFDLSGNTNTHVNYLAWFFNKHGGVPDDTLKIYLSDGTDVVLIDILHKDDPEMSKWIPRSIKVPVEIEGESSVQLIVTISDYPTNVNVCEAAFDYFFLSDKSLTDLEEKELLLSIYPNPFDELLIINGMEEGYLELYDLSGKLIESISITKTISLVHIEAGMYIAIIRDENGHQLLKEKLIKN